MRLEKLTQENACEIINKKIYCYEKSSVYLGEFLDKYNLLDNIVSILDDFKRNQGSFEFRGKQIDVVGTEVLETVDLSDVAILITSDYYMEAYERLCEIDNVSVSLNEIYYFVNAETEVELAYRERYKDSELEDMIVFRSGPHASERCRR